MVFRVLHMSSENGWRGGEQQVGYLVNELILKDVQNILMVKNGSRLENFCRERKVPYYNAKFANSFDILSAMKVIRLCRKENVDIIHIHTSKAQGIAVLAAVLGNKIPMVLSRRVAFIPGRNLLSKWKYNYPRIKRILCISQKITAIMRNYVSDPAKCITVYSGIDLNKFKDLNLDKTLLKKELGLGPNKRIIATVGAIDRSKDHFTFVDTIEKTLLHNVNIHGVIIGDGPLKKEMNDYVNSKGLAQQISFTGYRKDVLQLLPSADIFLMTSQEEGLGTSILDAFLARIPVVATAAGGIPEIVKHMETGLLAPVKDATALSRHVTALLNDDKLSSHLVNQAFQFVAGFSKENTANKTMDVYEKVLKDAV